MEEKKLQIRQARMGMNRVGAALIVYYIIMNIAVSIAMLADLCVYLFSILARGDALTMDQLMERIMDFATGNGWGYILAIIAGCVIVLLWKGKDFCFREMFTKEKKMTPGVFLMLLCVFIAPQAILQLYAPALEWLLNQMGLSAMAALEMATITTDKLSMFLYISLLGPVAEELLFRGLLLRLLRPYGKQAAILVSALLFGLFHGNIIQIPFAFLVGLVLGYVTVEYSIVWAMVLHIINNFVLSDLMGRLAELLPEVSTLLMWGIFAVATIATVVLLLLRRKDVSAYLRENRLDPIAAKGALTSPALWIFAVMMLLSSLLTITRI